MKPKVLFIILGVLVVLFLVGTGLNVGKSLGSEPDPAATPAWGESVRGFLEQSLDADDVQIAFPNACRAQLARGVFELQEGDGCELLIAEAATNLRALTLDLTGGVAATVAMDPASDERLPSEENLDADAGETEVKVSIFKEGGTLTITCDEGDPCRLAVVD